MTETQLAEENQEAQTPPETQTTEDKFLGVKSTVGTKTDSNIEVEVVDDRPIEDQKPPRQNTDSEEEIDELSGNANKRIKKLKYDYHEERREKEKALRLRDEAVNHAKRAVAENHRLSRLVGSGQEELIKQAKEKAEFAKQAAQKKYKEAYEAGDAEKIAEAQQILTEATFASSQAESLPQQVANEVYQQEIAEQQSLPQQPPVPQPDDKALKWQENNSWFGSDEEMTNFAYGVHAKLVKENIDPRSDDYYNRIDKRMKEVFPDAFGIETQEQDVAEPVEDRKSPISTEDVVAPATRNNGARPKKVKLTATQVSLARKLGITPEQYAAELIKDKR